MTPEEFAEMYDPPQPTYTREDIPPDQQCPRCNARLKGNRCNKCHWRRKEVRP